MHFERADRRYLDRFLSLLQYTVFRRETEIIQLYVLTCIVMSKSVLLHMTPLLIFPRSQCEAASLTAVFFK